MYTEKIDAKECWEFFNTAYKEKKNKEQKNKEQKNKEQKKDLFYKFNESKEECRSEQTFDPDVILPDEKVYVNNTCTGCGYIEYIDIDVCTNCGLMFVHKLVCYDENDMTNSYNPNNEDCNGNDNNGFNLNNFKKVNNSQKFSRISQMQNWYKWSKDEKNTYKLGLYIKNLCATLNIELYIDYICDLVTTVLDKIKDNEGSKRTRVKDGIIVVCIYYTYKKNNVFVNSNFTTSELSKSIHLDMKYITKAEKFIIELINRKKLHLDKSVFLGNNSPLSYIKNNIVHFNLDKQLLQHVYNQVEILIQLCEDEEILLDHTPLSIGIGCFYYILKKNNIDIDITHFSKIYKLSCVTISKLTRKLNLHFDT